MQDLFVDKDDQFEVEFYVATDKQANIWADLKENTLKEILDKSERYEIKKYNAVFRQPSFGDTIGLYDNVFSTIDGANIRMNPLAARYKKISLLIKSWDLADKEGNQIEPTEENIGKLHPIVANVLGIQVDIITGTFLA